jgi:AcrR family transcriptional regulator
MESMTKGTMMAASEGHGLRADAARNRKLLVDAAVAAFGEHGVDVSIAEIARRAGIAKGTVFRHFATKQHLMAAILRDQLDRLAAVGEELLAAADPAAALLDFMAAIVEQHVSDRSFCAAVNGPTRADPEVRAASHHLSEIADALTDRAREQGAVRDDLTGQDVILLPGAAYQAAAPLGAVTPDLWRRYLSLIFDGLRPDSARPLPHPAPTAAQLTRAALEAAGTSG